MSSKTPSSRRLAVLAALAVSLLGLPPAALAADFDIPPDLGAYTVLSCQDMQMSGNSVITSEGVVGGTAGDGVAHVRSNGNIVLSGTVDIHGNVTAGPGKQVTTSGNPTVTGTKGPAASAYNCTPIDLTVLRTALEANNDNSRVPRTDKNRVALGGGDGRTLTMSGNDGLTLPAGTYLFSSISLSGSSQLRVSGQVRILVTGSVSVSGGSHINLNGNPFQMRLWTQGAVAISSQSNVHAYLYSPTAAVSLSGQMTIVGALQVKSLQISGGARIRRVLDDAFPVITLTAPAAGASVTACQVTVSGRATDAEGPIAQVKVNGVVVPVAADGSFSTTASLATADPGLIEVLATDGTGNVSRLTRRVSIVEPTVTLTSPASGSLLGSRTVSLAGTCGNATSVKVNGLAAVVPGDGTFRFDGFDLGAADGIVTLNLSATNCGGSATATAVLDLDTKAPVVSIDSPANHYLASSSPIVVTGTVVDAHLTSVLVKGVAAEVDGQRFSVEVPLAEGNNALTAAATDALGRSTTSVPVAVELDSEAPGVTITTPENNQVVTSTSIQVQGTVTDSHPSQVVVNGVTATLAGNDFTANAVPLLEGENRIIATATDTAGHSTSTQAVVVVRDTLPPVLTLDAAALPSLTENGTVTVHGTVSDPHLDKVAVNGVEALVDGTAWAAEGVPLQEGANAIVAHAADTLGHTADTAPITVSRDSLPPQVAVTEPAAGAQLDARTVTVRGTVSDPHLDRVTVLGVAATLSGGTFEAANVPVPEGASQIAAHAVDTLSHESDSAAVAVVVDTLPPVVRLDPPGDPAVTTPAVTVTGTVEEPHLAELTVSGIAATVNADGTFSVPGVPLAEGTNEVVALASDTFGHETTSGAVVYDLDSSAPQISITSPIDGQVVASLQVQVTGTVTDAHLASVTVNGVAATIDAAAGTFSALAQLTDGANTLRAVATDQGGHTAEATVTVALDSLPPAVTLDQPAVAAGACLAAGSPQALGGAYGDPFPATGQNGQPAPVTLDVRDASGAVRSYAGSLAAGGQRWSAQGVDLGAADGVTTVLVTATDAQGSSSRVSGSFRIDATAPLVTLLLDGAPFPGAAAGATAPAGTVPVLFGRAVRATASVLDGAAGAPPSAVLTLDGAPYLAGTPVAVPGNHLLVATATDCAGHASTVHALFAVDTAAPALLSTDPANGARVTAALTHFAGTSDADLARATVNGLPAVVGANGAFSLTPFAWREGRNEVAIELEDRAGNRATYNVTFTVRTVPLSVAILESGAPIAAGTVFLRAVSPEVRPSDSTATVTATLNGAPYASGTPITQPGSYTLAASAGDDWGRSAQAQATFTLDLGAAPQMAITSPADGAVLSSATARVEGTVSGDAPTVTVNGVAATVTGSTWVVAALPLEADVANPIEAVARDRRGRTAGTTITVRVVSAGPQVLILEPADGTITNRSAIDVAGAVLGGRARSADGKVTVQGVAIDLAPDGTFRAQDVPLQSGQNTLTASVRDREQRTGSASVTVRADFTPPALRFLARTDSESPLLDGASFGRPITLVVEVEDDGALAGVPSVRLNGALQAGAAAPRTEVALDTAGGYVLSVSVKDQAGNETRGERSFVLDFGGCSLEDVEPVAGSGLAASSVTLVGRAVGAASIKVRVPQVGGGTQEYAASLADGTFLAGDLPLPVVGVNNLELVCTDATGRAVSKAHAIERLAAGTGPSIHIASPLAGTVLSADSVAVTGSVSSGAVTVNGLSASLQAGTPQSTFRANAVPLAEGPNPLLARAVDGGGRSAEDRVVVSRDTQAPRVQITRPDNHSRVGVAGGGLAKVDVSGLVDLDTEPNLDRVVVSTPAGAITATVDPATGIFLAQGVPLDPAASSEQTITATATDSLGHSGQGTVGVSLDATGPAIVLSAPADLTRFGASATAPISIQGEAWAAPGAAISVNGIDLDPTLLAWEPPGADGRRHVSFTATLNLPAVAAEGAAFGIIARATDLDGRWAQDRRLLFRDAQAPRVVEFVPADAATGVDPNGLLLVLFSEPILHGSLDAADGLVLTRVSTGQAVVGSKAVAGQAVAFAPGVALAAGEVYLLHAGRGITDLAGNPLASAAEARFTVASRSTGAAPVLDALPAVLCTSEIQVKGHAAAGTTIKVRDGDLVFTGFADASGAFTVAVPVAGSGYHLLAAWTLDTTSGERSAEASAVVRIDCQAPSVTDAVLDRTTGVIRIVFSEAVKATSLTVGDASASIRLLDAEVPAVYRSATVALPAATTAEVHLDTAASAWWRDRPVRLQVGPPASDPEGNAMTATFERVFFPGGGELAGGFLFGEVYDDTTGRPQSGAAVGLYASGAALPGSVAAGQAASPVTGAVADGRGRFVLAGEVPSGRYVLVAAGAQTTRVYRHLSLRPAAGIVPFDSRVTPLADPAGNLTPAAGGSVSLGGLTFAADPAVLPGTAPVSVRLTPLSGQGLPDFLPLGWTPATAAEVRLEQGGAALPESAGLWTEGGARVELPLPAWAGPGTDLFAARYEPGSGRWLALPAPEVLAAAGGQPARVRLALSGPGPVVVAVPDSEPANRPPSLPAAPGDALVGAERPAEAPALTADLTLNPAVVGPTGRSRARVVARSADGTSLWPSGLAVQAYLEEKLVLTSGGTVFEAPFSADLVLYHPPLSAAEQGTAAAGAAGAMDFAVSPSPRAAQVLLDVGFENIRLFPFPEEVERGPVLGPDGGSVTSASGVELTVPEGALTAKVPVEANLLTPAELAALPAIAGYDTLAGVRIEFSGSTLARAATLSIPKPSTTPAEALGEPKVILAEWLEAPEDGRGALARLAARTQRLGSGQTERIVASPELAGTLPLDGIEREGLYLLLAAHQPLGFATGLVKTDQGQGGPLAASRVTVAGLGTGDLSRLAGRYSVPVAAGAARVLTALHPARDERGTGTIANLPAGQVAALDLVVQPVAPRILSVAPLDNSTDQPVSTAVSVLFSEPLASATVTSSTLTLELLDGTGAATGVFVQGTVSLADGVRAVFAPSRPLLPGRGYRATFAGGVADAGGTIYTGGPVVWTFSTSVVVTPGGQVHPEKFHIRVPVDGVAEIYGDPGAVPGAIPGQTSWIVSPEIDGPVADPVRDSFQAHADGSFTGSVGHPPNFAVTLESKVYVKVFDPTGTLAAQFRVGPFATPDGLGFVAPAGEEVTFRSAEGLVVDVPAAAFQKATLVKVRLLNPATLGVPVPQGLGMGAYVDVDFDGEAQETLRVSVPAPAGVADGTQVFMGRVTDLPWGPRLQLLSAGGVLERDGQRYLSNDPSLQPEPETSVTGPSTAKVRLKAGGRTCRTARLEGLNRCFLQSLLMEFTLRSHAAFLYEQGSDWALISGVAGAFPLGLGIANEAIFNFLADTWVYLPRPQDWNGGFVLPVISSQPLELTRRDTATGWTLERQRIDPVAAGKDLVDIGLVGEGQKGRPLLVDARPFQLYTLPAPEPKKSARLSLEMEVETDASGNVKVAAVEDFPLPRGTSVSLFDLAPALPPPPAEGEPEPQAQAPIAGPSHDICTEDDDSWSTPPFQASEHLLVVVAPGGLDSATLDKFELQFDRKLKPLKDKPVDQVAKLIDLGPLKEGCAASTGGGYPKPLPIVVEQSEQGGRVAFQPLSLLAAGHRFRLELIPAAFVADAKGAGSHAYWNTAPTRFEFATREVPGEPISELPSGTEAFGSTSVARDMLKLGNLLVVASEAGDLVAFDVSRASEMEGMRRHAIKNRPGLQYATRSLATDGHNRIFYSGLFGNVWGIKAIRLEDVRKASEECVNAPSWAQGLPCFEGVEGSVRVAYSLGSVTGTTASEWLALGSLPEATPMEMSVLTQDEEGKELGLDDFVKAYVPGGAGLAGLTPDAEGIYTFTLPLKSTLSRSRSGAAEPSQPPGTPAAPPVEKWRKKVCSGEEDYDRYQRVTVDNLSTGQTWSIDVENPWPEGGSGNGTANLEIKARRGDRLQVRYNLRTLAHVALLGSGITVVDLNRFYRLLQPGQSPGGGQCGRRLGKFEGQQIDFPSCAPPGIELTGIAMTPSIATHSKTGCKDGQPCRGDGFIDIYSPLTQVGAVHTRSTATAPGGVEGELSPNGASSEALQLGDFAACLKEVGNNRVQLRDVALANNVDWVWNGVRGQLDGAFQPPASGFKTQHQEGDLLFVSLGLAGIYVFDVSGRSLQTSPVAGPSLIGHLYVKNHTAFRLQVDSAHGLLFAGGTDTETNRPIIDVWDLTAVNGAPGLRSEIAPRATLHAPWSTNQLGIDATGTGLLYTWGGDEGPQVVPFDRARFVFAGLYRPEKKDQERGIEPELRPATRFVPLGVPLETSLKAEKDNHLQNERKSTAAFKVRVALPGSLGPELTAKVQSLRLLPGTESLGEEKVGAALMPPGGKGWPKNEVVVRLRRIGIGSEEGTGAALTSEGGPLGSAYQLYESVETVVLMADPRARAGYKRQDVNGDDKSDEAAQCRRCDWPGYLPDPYSEDPALKDVKGLLAGYHVRAFLFPTAEDGISATTRLATEKAIQFFERTEENYPLPAASAEVAGAADAVPSPVQVSLAEPAQSPAMWDPDEANVSVALAGGDLLLTATDHAVAGRSLPFSFDRTYRSGSLGYGPLGSAGWSGSLFSHLRELVTGEVEYHDGRGHVWRYFPGSLPEPPEGSEKDESGSYHTPKGVYLRLQRLPAGQGWRLIGTEHEVALYDGAGRLKELADRHYRGGTQGEQGSRLQLRYDAFGQLLSLEDDLGRSYEFEYYDDPRPTDAGGDGPRYGLLKRIEDFAKREILYEYDTDRRLTKVKLPEVKNPVDEYAEFSYTGARRPVVEYRYEPDLNVDPGEGTVTALLHGDFAALRLSESRLPDFVTGVTGVPRARFEYDQATGRIAGIGFPTPANQNAASASVKWSLTYPEPAPTKRATVTAPWGHPVQYTLKDGRITQLEESLDVYSANGSGAQQLVTGFTYTDDGRPRLITRPDGSSTRYCYAAKENGEECVALEGDRLSRGRVARTVVRALSSDARGLADYESLTADTHYDEDNIAKQVKDGDGRTIDVAVAKPNKDDATRYPAEGEKVPASAVHYDYDRYGRIKKRAGGENGPTLQIAYGKDAHGREQAGLTAILQHGSGLLEIITRDDAYNVKRIENSEGIANDFLQDDWDRTVREREGLALSGPFASVGAGRCGENAAVTERAFDAVGHVVRERRLQDYVSSTGSSNCRWVETRYRYNAREQVTSVEETHLASSTTPGDVIAAPTEVKAFTFDEHGRLHEETARADVHPDVATVYRYDGAGRVAGIKVGDEGEQLQGYDKLSRIVFKTDGDQGTWKGKFDAWGRLYLEELSTGASIRRKFDGSGNPLSESVFADGQRVSLVRTKVTSFGALSSTTEVLKDAEDNRPAEERVTQSFFDDAGRLVSTWSGPSESEGEIDLAHARRVTEYEYESAGRAGRLKSESQGGSYGRPSQVTQRYTYESRLSWPDVVKQEELVPGEEDAETSTVRYRRDAFGRPIEIRSSDGSLLTTEYDRGGDAIRQRTGSGAETTLSFDGQGRLVRFGRPQGRGETSYAYDLDGALLREETSAETGQWATAYSYDGSSRLTGATYADGTSMSQSYNPDSTAKTRTTRDGVLLTFTYDASNRLRKVVPSVSGGGAGTRTDAGDAVTYDTLSRPTSVERGTPGLEGLDPELAVKYPLYDMASRPASEVVGTRAPLTWRYNLWDEAEEVTLPAGAGRNSAGSFTGWSRRYDSLGQLEEVSGLGAASLSPTTLGARWDWGGAGRLYAMTTKGTLGTGVRYGYHGGRGPQSQAGSGQAAWNLGTMVWGAAGTAGPTSPPQSSWGSFAFGWRGNEGSPSDGAKVGREVVAAPAAPFKLFGGLGWSWGYDAGVRLTSASAGAGSILGQAPPAGTSKESFRFEYGKGDELERSIRNATGEVAQNTIGAYGRILARKGATFSYDGAGRRTQDDRFLLVWDWRGQLVSATVKDTWPDEDGDGKRETTPWAGHQVRYRYDALGRLAKREVYGKLPAGVTDDAQRPFIEQRTFVWEGESLLAEAAYGASGSEASLRWRINYVPGPSGLDDPVQVVVDTLGVNPRTYTYVRDEMGSVVGVVAEDESSASRPAIGVRYRYTPYGQVHAETGPELERARLSADDKSAGGVTQTILDPRTAAPGSLVLNWSLDLDPASLTGGISVERYTAEDGWTALPSSEVVVALDSEDGSRVLVMAVRGWDAGGAYRVKALPDLSDTLGRTFGKTESFEWNVANAPAEGEVAPIVYDKRFRSRFEAWEAASETLGDRFPGGQTALFHGTWTDPVTGFALHRARWRDARTAVFLSEDPLLDIDSPNLFAYAGLNPAMASDPQGLCLGFNDEVCSATADRFSGWIREKESNAYSDEAGFWGFMQDWGVGAVADAAEMFLSDPLRAGQATGDAIGSDAGAGEIALSVLEDTGRVAQLAGTLGTGVKAVGAGAKLVRATSQAARAARVADEIAATVRANVAASRAARATSKFAKYAEADLAIQAEVKASKATSVAQVTANRAAGNAARDAIALREAPALIEQNMRVSGGLRRIDVLKLGEKLVGIESKVGRTGLTPAVRQELARDVKLLRSQQLSKVRWEFWKSARTGLGGPTAQLRRKLIKFGIEIVEHQTAF